MKVPPTVTPVKELLQGWWEYVAGLFFTAGAAILAAEDDALFSVAMILLFVAVFSTWSGLTRMRAATSTSPTWMVSTVVIVVFLTIIAYITQESVRSALYRFATQADGWQVLLEVIAIQIVLYLLYWCGFTVVINSERKE